MNIDTTTPKISNSNTGTASITKQTSVDTSFQDELKNLSDDTNTKTQTNEESKPPAEEQEQVVNEEKPVKEEDSGENENIEEAIDGLQNVVEEINKSKQEDVPQEDDLIKIELKKDDISSDKFNKKEDSGLINNDMNIQDSKEQILPQMEAGMNFNSSGQPFSAFVKKENTEKLSSSEKELKEENEILSTMADNLAMINRNNITQNSDTKTIANNEGIRKVDSKSNITVDTVVKFDSVAMNKNDVDFFANLVQNSVVNMDSVENAESAKISKTLADLLAKSMNENKPVRINFDNDISVIIRISKDGKISADFLPSSQVAEAYLKENLPLLKQKFDDNNIDYDELNHRQQKQDDRDNRKKGRKDE